MQQEGETGVAAQAASQVLAAAIASSLARTAALLRAAACGEVDGSAADDTVRLLQEVAGALAFAQQPAAAALVRLMQAQMQCAGLADPAGVAPHANAAQALQRCVAYTLGCAQRQCEPCAARLLRCWRQIAALGGGGDVSPAALLSLQPTADLPPLPSVSVYGDPLADAERALLICLRTEGDAVPGDAAQAFAGAVAMAAAGAQPDHERACWLALHAWLQELAAADGVPFAAGKRFLAATLRALRHRQDAGLPDLLEPLVRDALRMLSGRTLQTTAAQSVARLFRLDEQSGEQPADDGAAPQDDAAPASFAAAVAARIAELEQDGARLLDPALWQALAADAAWVSCVSELADPLARLAQRVPQMQDDRQRELLAALLVELHAWTEEGGGCAAALIAIVDLAGDAEPAVAGIALHRHQQASGARRRLAALCGAMRAELDTAEQPLEAAWQGGDWAQARQAVGDVLARVAGALAVTGLQAECDAANTLRATLAACADEAPRAVLAEFASAWVGLASALAILPFRSDAPTHGTTPDGRAPTAIAGEARDRLQSIFIDEAAGYLHSLRRIALPCDGQDAAAAQRAAHTLAGCSATIGLPAMASLALALESHLASGGWRRGNALLAETVDALDRMLADFIGCGQCDAQAELLLRLRAGVAAPLDSECVDTPDDRRLPDAGGVHHEAGAGADEPTGGRIESGDAAATGVAAGADDVVQSTGAAVAQVLPAREALLALAQVKALPFPASAADDLSSQELLATFREEAADLLPQLELALDAWQQHPDDSEPPAQLLRLLHTLKGSARMAGRLALGDAFHDTEADVATLARQPAAVVLRALPDLQARFDGWLQGSMPDAPQAADTPAVVRADTGGDASQAAMAKCAADAAGVAQDVGRVPTGRRLAPPAAASSPQLRVSAERLARVADGAAGLWVGNVGIADAAQEQRQAVASLSEDLARLRAQLRELEIEAESRIVAHASPGGDAGFDPLEFDRYTRLHELTRLMAESLADLAGTQRGLARQVERLASAASAQARDLRRFGLDLKTMRSQPLRAAEPRLRHLLRQAAQEAGREAALALAGGDVEIERSLLDRLAGPLGHLLRNAVVHGIEAPAQRIARGKPPTGTVTLGAALAGSELRLWLQDDGGGVDLARVRSRANAAGLLGADDEPDDAALAALIFAPGFSTASEVTALAGRGIGMDAVRAELQALGGRITVDSVAGQGCRFTLTVPVALASLPVLLAMAGTRRIALPAALIVQVVQPRPAQVERDANGRWLAWRDGRLALRHLGEALGERSKLSAGDADRLPVVIVEEGERRLALQLDSMLGQRELMLRHPGPQLAQVPGMTGATLLGDGSIALIIDPFRLPDTPPAVAGAEPERPLVLVVDDSLTVRRASQRLLERHGYAVALARDGLEALERLAERRPAALLLDIEMPRMDGFELLAALRADAGLSDLPVVMITSRIAGRHRERAQQLGVLGYLCKPFDEEVLLAMLARLQGAARLAA